MFWGVTIESGKRYSQVVENSFHLSMAALEPTTKEIKKPPNNYVSVMVDQSDTEFLLCSLQHGKTMQVGLDLIFVEGEQVSFFLNGEGTVHLTGYVINDEDEIESDNSELSVDGAGDSEDWSTKKAKKRKPSQDFEQVTIHKKLKQLDQVPSPKMQPKAASPKKSPKVDIVEMPSTTPQKSPFTNKEPKSEKKKKTPPKNVQFEASSDDEDASVEEWEDADSDGDESDEESSTLSDDEEPRTSFTHKLDSQNVKDSIVVTKNKNLNASKGNRMSPGDAKNKSFSGKQKDEKFGVPKKDSFSKANTSSNIQELTPKSPKAKGQNSSPKTPKTKLQGGIEVEDIRAGNGPAAKPGKHVHVYYVGKLPNNKEFDSVTKGKPFSFRLGKGEVIKGWDVAIQGMKVGGKRKISVPPHMGYGNKPQGPIPANSTLHFEVELKAVS